MLASRIVWAASKTDAVCGNAMGSGVIMSATVPWLVTTLLLRSEATVFSTLALLVRIRVELVVFVVQGHQHQLGVALGGLYAVYPDAIKSALGPRIDQEHRRAPVLHDLIVWGVTGTAAWDGASTYCVAGGAGGGTITVVDDGGGCGCGVTSMPTLSPHAHPIGSASAMSPATAVTRARRVVIMCPPKMFACGFRGRRELNRAMSQSSIDHATARPPAGK